MDIPCNPINPIWILFPVYKKIQQNRLSPFLIPLADQSTFVPLSLSLVTWHHGEILRKRFSRDHITLVSTCNSRSLFFGREPHIRSRNTEFDFTFALCRLPRSSTRVNSLLNNYGHTLRIWGIQISKPTWPWSTLDFLPTLFPVGNERILSGEWINVTWLCFWN